MAKGASTTQKETGTQAVQLPEWMSSAGQNLFNKTMTDSAAHPVTGYNGEMTAPNTPNQQQASGQAAQTPGMGQGQVGLGSRIAASATGSGNRVGAANFDQSAATKYMSPYLE